MEELAEQTPSTAPLTGSEESSDSDDLPQDPARNPVDEWVEGEGWVEHKISSHPARGEKRPRGVVTFIGKGRGFYEEEKGNFF